MSLVIRVLYTDDGMGLSFELQGKAVRDVVQTTFIFNGAKHEYFNPREFWQRFNWPGSSDHPGGSLSGMPGCWPCSSCATSRCRGRYSLARTAQNPFETPRSSCRVKRGCVRKRSRRACWITVAAQLDVAFGNCYEKREL